ANVGAKMYRQVSVRKLYRQVSMQNCTCEFGGKTVQAQVDGRMYRQVLMQTEQASVDAQLYRQAVFPLRCTTAQPSRKYLTTVSQFRVNVLIANTYELKFCLA
ncbi:hypothetical protein CHS0354_022922, partial [Potamilus streckersoni]